MYEHPVKIELYKDLQFLCLFIGYPRSGHSVLGALLDGHPDIVITHEFNILSKFRTYRNSIELFDAILDNSKKSAEAGRVSYQYSYRMSDLSQGESEFPKVLGDKMGSKTTLLLDEDFTLIEQLEKFCDLPIRFLHVVRNPFDIITTKAGYYHGTRAPVTLPNLEKSAAQIAKEVRINHRLIEALKERVLTLRHEDLILDFSNTIKKVLLHFELRIDEDYVRDAEKYVFKNPKPSRFNYPWPDSLKDEVFEQIITKFSFMKEYSY